VLGYALYSCQAKWAIDLPTALLTGLHGVARRLPRGPSTQKRFDIGKPELEQFQRRTGAGPFVRSSAVKDDLGASRQLASPRVYL
jgi:hypothetical protein